MWRRTARPVLSVGTRAAASALYAGAFRAGTLRHATQAADGAGAAWTEQWLAATNDVRSTDVSFEDSADRLRDLVRTGLLGHTDLRDKPERFFEAHRILARHAVDHGPGFWIRFTVHYNLWAGTILAVGSDEQVAAMAACQDAGQLGCFALTEKLAGVQSGLVVQTTATWDADAGADTAAGDGSGGGGFVLHSPTTGSHKNWISQGFTADKAVVLADLRLSEGDGSASLGPHAFAIDLRDPVTGALSPGVSLGDMGAKTTGNDLDNAWIAFDGVRVPRSALLDRYATVVPGAGGAGARYVQRVEGMSPFHMIGQRLYTGRVAVAQAALAYTRRLFGVTRAYAEGKPCVSHATLAELPQLRAVFADAEAELAALERFAGEIELELCSCLRQEAIPSEQLIEAIATAKVRAVERSIALCFRLKQDVGSFALMADAGFKHLDFLQCCKFAEGDSRILMQKLARDRLKEHKRGGAGAGAGAGQEQEQECLLCERIQEGMARELEAGATKGTAWDEQWRDVYALADLVMDRIMSRYE